MNILRRCRLRFLLGLVLFCLLFPSPSSAQDGGDSCPELVHDALTVVGSACREMGRNEACYGHTLVAATFQEDSDTLSFESDGDTIAINTLEAMVTEPADPETGVWGIALLKVLADLPDEEESNLTFVMLGDSEITNEAPVDTELVSCSLTNEEGEDINIYAGPGDDRPITTVLPADGEAMANGRDEAGDWLRIERNRRYGWVPVSSVNLSCEVSTLSVADENDLRDLYSEPMQAFTISSGETSSCSDAPDGVLVHAPEGTRARVLVNGVELDIGSATFLNAVPDGELVVIGLEGSIGVESDGKAVTVLPGFGSSVPLTGLQASGQPEDPEPVDTGDLPFLLGSTVYGASPTPRNISTSTSARTVGEPMLINVNFTGTSRSCPATQTKPPLDAVLVIDRSGSMTGELLAAAQGSAASFVQRLNPETDQVAVVGFDSTGFVAQSLTSDLDAALGAIYGLSASGGTAIDQGLLTGYSEVTSVNSQENAVKVIVLLSDGGSDPGAATAAANVIRGNGIRLISIGIGEFADYGLLGSLASDNTNFFEVDSALELREVYTDLVVELSEDVAARDITVTYAFDPELFEFIESVSTGAEVVSEGVVRWSVPVVYNSQTLDFPLVLRPLQEGTLPTGNAVVSYTACEEGEAVSLPPTQGRFVEVVAAAPPSDEPIRNDEGVLQAGASGVGTLENFESQDWLVDTPEDGLFSVTVAGAGTGSTPQLLNADNEPVDPLYTVRGGGESVSVFATDVDLDLAWLVVESGSPEDEGEYSIQMQSDEIAAPSQTLTFDDEPVRSAQSNFDGEVYAIEATEGDVVTINYLHESGDIAFYNLEVYVLSLDGQLAKELYRRDSFEGDVNVVQEVRGQGPYRVYVKTDGVYSLGIQSGDTLREFMGDIAPGDIVTGTIGSNGEYGIAYYTFDGEEGESISAVIEQEENFPNLLIQNADGDVLVEDAFQYIFGSDFTLLTSELRGPGPYTITVEATGTYQLRVAEGGGLAAEKDPLALGTPISESISEDSYVAYHQIQDDLQADDLITLRFTDEDAAPLAQAAAATVTLLDASGNQLVPIFGDATGPPLGNFAGTPEDGQLSSLYRLVGTGPYTVRVAGQVPYTLVVEEGDTLREPVEQVTLGEVLELSGGGELLLKRYELVDAQGNPLPSGTTVAVTLNGFFSDDPFLESTSGTVIPAARTYPTSNQETFFFTLLGNDPLLLNVETFGDLTVTIESSENFLVEKGVLNIDDTLNDSATNLQLVSYTLDLADQTVSIELRQPNNFNIPLPEMRNAQGRPVVTFDSFSDVGYYVAAFNLGSDGPYTFEFPVQGGYTISLTSGNALVLDKGVLTIDQRDVNSIGRQRLKLVYALDTMGNDIFSVQVDKSAGTSIAVSLQDSDGNPLTAFDRSVEEVLEVLVFEGDADESYTLTVEAERNFTVTLLANDALRFSKGFLIPTDTIQDRFDEGAEPGTWDIKAEPGETVSVEVIGSRFNDPPLNEMVDGAGNVITPVDVIESGGYNLSAYELTDSPPYTLSFRTPGNYTLNILPGDATKLPMGDYPIGEIVRERVDTYARIVQYDINPPTSQLMSVQLSLADRTLIAEPVLLDENGNSVAPEAAALNANEALVVYDLQGNQTYTLSFEVLGNYTVTVSEGDVARADLGEVPFGQNIRNRLPAPAQIAVYALPGSPGDVITLQTKDFQGEVLVPDVLDSNDVRIEPFLEVTTSTNDLYTVYELEGDAPFRISLSAPLGYFLTAYEGDAVREDKGPASMGEPIPDQLTAPAQIAVYTIPASAGDLVTLDLQPRNRNPLLGTLTTGDGTVIEPLEAVTTDVGRTIGVYEMEGSGPYTFSFPAEVGYTLTVSDGDVLRVDKDVVYEETVSDELVAPAFFARYSLDDDAGDYVTITVTNRSGGVEPELVNSDGELISPDVQILDRNTSIVVYQMSAATPHQFGFQNAGGYDITINRGDLVRIDKGVVPFEETISDELVAPERVVVYTIDASPGDYVSIQATSRGQGLVPEVLDGSGATLEPELQIRIRGFDWYVYRLSGEGPFLLRLTPQVTYDLTVSASDVSLIPMETAVTEGMVINGQVRGGFRDAYPLDVDAGEELEIYVTTNAPTVIDILVRNGAGDTISQPLEVDENGQPIRIREASFNLTVEGDPPYQLLVSAEAGYEVVLVGNLDPESGIPAYTDRTNVNLRSGPDRNAEVVTQANPGDQFVAVGRNNARDTWIMLYLSDGQTVWVHNSLILPVDAEDDFSTLPIMSP